MDQTGAPSWEELKCRLSQAKSELLAKAGESSSSANKISVANCPPKKVCKDKKKKSKKEKRKKRIRDRSSSSSSDTEMEKPKNVLESDTDTESDKKNRPDKSKLKKHRSKRYKSKKKRRNHSSTGSSSEDELQRKSRKSHEWKEYSSSDSEEWIERTTRQDLSLRSGDKSLSESPNKINTPKDEENRIVETGVHENWMLDSGLIPSYQRPVKESKPKQDIEKYDPATNVRELNPYWKENGTGLPNFQRPKEDCRSDDNKKKISRGSNNSRGNWRKRPTTDETLSNKEECPVRLKNEPITKSSTNSYKEESSERKQQLPKTSKVDLERLPNVLSAQALKAEMMGDHKKAQKLREEVQQLREQRAESKQQTTASVDKQNGGKVVDNEALMLTVTDNKGELRPLPSRMKPADPYGPQKSSKKKASGDTHQMGDRVRFFADDERYDIKQMFERERCTTSSDVNAQFVNMAGKQKGNKMDFDDIFAGDSARNMSAYEDDNRGTNRAMNEADKLQNIVETCNRCFESPKFDKDRIIAYGSNVYLTLSWHEGLQPGHCMIVPMQHFSCSTQLDDDIWREVNDFRKAITKMFAFSGQDVVFFETAKNLHRRSHMVIQCVPSSNFDMAPFYFKKAIEESEQEWSINKQLVTLKDKDLKRSIPKGLPYFWVNFGMSSGFAHVIEDQQQFPSNLAEELIGGILKLNPSKWRNPRKENNITAKVAQFADRWKTFDCTTQK